MNSKYFVHPSSFLEENVHLGEGTKVWHFSHILERTFIGDNCTVSQGCSIGPNVKIGHKVKIQNNVSVYEGVEIEDEVFVGPSVVFTNVFNPRSTVNRKHEFRKTLVKKGATLGANSTVICGVTIGAYAFVGAGSVVTRNVPDHALVFGNPAKQHAWYSRNGHKLNFDSSGHAKDETDDTIYSLFGNVVKIVQR